MSSLYSIFTLYIQIQVLLGVAFLLFHLTQRILRSTTQGTQSRILLRLGQLLIISSILVPITLSSIPTHRLPEIPLHLAAMLQEANTDERGHADKIADFSHSTQTSMNYPGENQTFFSSLKGHFWSAISMGQKFSAHIITALLLILGGGILLAALNLGLQISRLHRTLRESYRLHQIGQVCIWICDSITVPFSAWLGRKAHVVIPSDLLARVSARASEFRMAILHELQHHRQHDTVWALWMEGLLSVFWINPFIYLWKKEIIQLQELSCDEILIGRKGLSPYEYGNCLIRVAEFALNSRSVPVGTTCMASASRNSVNFKSLLKRRIEMFENYQKNYGHRNLERNLSLTLGTLATLCTITLAYASERTLRPNSLPKVNPGIAVFNPDIQKLSEKILHSHLTQSDAAAGFVLVSDPHTGKLLAAANEIRDPKFNLPQKTWSLSFQMVPASIIKPILAAAAIENGVTTLEESHFCENGSYLFGGKLYRDHTPFQYLTTAQTIAFSSDICSLKITEKLGPNSAEKGLQSFGFGPGGVTEGFPEAQAGSLPLPSELPSSEYLHMISVGGAETSEQVKTPFLTTPIEVLSAYATIANQGKLIKPGVASSPELNPTPLRQILSEKTSDQIKNALVLTVEEGTGKRAQSTLYTTAGKTSTGHFLHGSQNSESNRDQSHLDETSNFGGFAGFAPVNTPKIAVYAVVFTPHSEKVIGGVHAAPIFRDIVEAVLPYLQVKPDKK